MSEETFDQFETITGFRVRTYLVDFLRFIENDYKLIVDYFAGNKSTVDSTAYENLLYLEKQSNNVNNLIKVNKKKFSGTEHWLLLDQLEDIRVRILTILKSSKFLRSPKTNFGFSSSMEKDYFLGYQENLETISRNVLKSGDSENDWLEIAFRNKLSEGDYDNQGGIKIKISTPITQTIFLNSVIDNIEGIKVNGLDVKQYMNFIDNDLKVLSYEDTIMQAISILIGLKKGDVPEFPDFGLDISIVVGSNIGSLAYATLIRQITEVFDTDDTIIVVHCNVNYKNNITRRT